MDNNIKQLVLIDGLYKIQEKTHNGGYYADDNIIRPFKGRTIDLNKPVKVYRNLTFKDKKIFSVKQGNLVVAHAERLCLHDCEFIVNEKGRQRILVRKQKEVCAYVKGFLTGSGMGTTAAKNDLPCIITFDPYLNNTFISNNITQKTLVINTAWFTILGEEVRASYVN